MNTYIWRFLYPRNLLSNSKSRPPLESTCYSPNLEQGYETRLGERNWERMEIGDGNLGLRIFLREKILE